MGDDRTVPIQLNRVNYVVSYRLVDRPDNLSNRHDIERSDYRYLSLMYPRLAPVDRELRTLTECCH